MANILMFVMFAAGFILSIDERKTIAFLIQEEV
ncbi:hypothetical protein PVOR_12395 [Paenibacillus vortex V453]|uniref:Uncharacterized protein n=1 Tax=Paenibacillus vortex V453 TaxID=715225 RepID=A0A2R9SWM1_9BACL|nr:hypothetical protein PVOR_12395 [Paenibacillus vortex V453]